MHLKLLEGVLKSCTGTEGYLTRDGKLWVTLRMLVMIKGDVLARYPALAAFYGRFGAKRRRSGSSKPAAASRAC